MSNQTLEAPPLEMLDAPIDRSALAESVATFMVTTPGRVLVLHGKLAGGKTELLIRWVIPSLRLTGVDAWYGQCAPGIPTTVAGPGDSERFEAAVTRKGFIVLDDFDSIFALTRDERRDALARLFEQVQRPDAQAVIVLVTDTRQLNSVCALAPYDPGRTNAIFEIKSVGIAEGLRQLSEMHPESAAICDADVLDAVDDDSTKLEDRNWDVIIRLMDARFRQFRQETGERSIHLVHYREVMGGIEGILRTFVDGRLEGLDLEQHGNQAIGRAILERVGQAVSRFIPADFSDIPARLDISADRLGVVLASLTGPRGFLRALGKGEYVFVPPQVGAIIEEDLASSEMEHERPHRIVADGLRSWQLLGNLLPPQRFEEVHRARTHLILDSEQIRFMLQSALRHETAATRGASEYWLRRVRDRVDAMDILLSCLFNDDADVRLRGAKLLEGFPEPEVRDRLRILALADPDRAVRAQAVSSLERMQSDELLEELLRRAKNPHSPHRVEAIEALRIFKSARVANTLQALVNAPESETILREKAIQILGALSVTESVDALADIALHDPDADDRERAAKALSSIKSPDLNEHLLSEMRAPSPVARIRVTKLGIAVAALTGVPLFYLFLVLSALFTPVAPLVVLLAAAALLPLTGSLLKRLQSQALRRRSPKGLLGVLLFMVNAVAIVPWFHGLAHLMLGRRQKALSLFGWEVLGILLFMGGLKFYEIQQTIGAIYLVIGVVVFIKSYLDDVVEVLFDTIVSPQTASLERSRAAVYQNVFTNPVATELIFETLRSEEVSTAKFARALITRFGGNAQPDKLIELLQADDQTTSPLVLQALRKSKALETRGHEELTQKLESVWSVSSPPLKRKIARILCVNPNQRSVDALAKIRGDLDPVLRIRTTLARWHYRFNVLPRQLRVGAVLASPAVAIFLFHGTMVFQNPAWSQVSCLRSLVCPAAQKTNAAGILADYYPKEAEEELPRLFAAGTFANPSPIASAVARGLVKTLATGTDDARKAVHDVLAGGRQVQLEQALLAADSATFDRAMRDIESMSQSTDSARAYEAIGLLRGLGLASDSLTRAVRAVEAIARLDSARALPALDSLRTKRIVTDQVTSAIQEQIERVTEKAYEDVQLGQDKILQGERLMTVLNSLKYTPASVKAAKDSVPLLIQRATEEIFFGESDTGLACDQNDDGTCDDKDNALLNIAKNPSSEDSYRDLLGHFLEDKEYAQAAAAFVALRKDHSESVWPRKILSEIQHEYLAPGSVSAFQDSYNEMVALRKLRAYNDLKGDAPTYDRFESDYVEVALSAKQYAETERVGRDMLTRALGDVPRLNVALFVYMAQVMQGNRRAAESALAQLEAVIKKLPPSFYNGWRYPGTEAFVRQSALPEDLRMALLQLCKEGYWYDATEAAKVVEANRKALAALAGKNSASP